MVGLELAGRLGSVWEVGSAGPVMEGTRGVKTWGVSHDSLDFGLNNRLFGMPPHPPMSWVDLRRNRSGQKN